jgi:ferredoxin
MPRLFIDNREVTVDDGTTILDAAARLAIEIPTMCFLEGCKPSTSCMVCVVKVEGCPTLVPACGAIAQEGMRVRTDSEEVRQARKAALELLLSDHLGDCIGPCHATCPAGMNIPLMIRRIAAGRLRDAIITVKADIALPAVLGRICPGPCEKACRRAAFDEAVSICLLKRYVADVDLRSPEPYMPVCETSRNKKVAVVGAGPAGLAAAYYLKRDGYAPTVFDDHEKPGGMLQYAVPEQQLPRDVLDSEIALIEKLGVEFRLNTPIGEKLSLEDLRRDFDAVFVATGRIDTDDAAPMGLDKGRAGIAIDAATYQTNLKGVFAGGDAVRSRRLTVRAVADGREAAVSIGQYLSGGKVAGPSKPFNVRIGRLEDGEIEKFMTLASREPRVGPAAPDSGFTDEQARRESLRCLHCDCRKADDCRLRQYSRAYDAKPSRYKGERRSFVQSLQHPQVIYEPGKCIDCGLCIDIAAKAGEKIGLTFVGRGFDVKVAVPFDRSMADALTCAAQRCAAACPTGALAFKDETETADR